MESVFICIVCFFLSQWDIKVHILLTGTPVQNNLQELYSLLNFVDSSKFKLSGSETFVEKFSSKTQGDLDQLYSTVGCGGRGIKVIGC